MKKVFFALILALALFASCNDDDTLEDNTYVCNECSGIFSDRMYMWVANKLTTNPDDPTQKCIKVQFDNYESDTSWTPFCQDICGFDYEEGFLYELYIERKKEGTDDNGDPIYKYCLLYIVSKKPMPMKKNDD